MSRSAAICFTLVAVGVGLRALLLLAAPELGLIADESSHAYLALAWNRFGFLPDHVDFLWPPAYLAALAAAFRHFEAGGLLALKIAQVLVSGSIGIAIAVLARQLFGPRSAVLAAALWAFHLPLASYTHWIRPETLFLSLCVPAIALLYRALDRPTDSPGSWIRLAGSGAMLGGALLVKQAALPILILVVFLLLMDRAQGPLRERGVRAAAFALAAIAVALPWTLRNLDVYDRVVIGGATLGRNLHHGVNGHYRNFDYQGQRGGPVALYGDEHWFVRAFIKSSEVPIWPTSQAPNVIDRSSENGRRAAAWAAAHPGFFVRSRIKKLADAATPLSFFVTYTGRGSYEGTALGGSLRPWLVGLALSTSVVILAAAIAGAALSLRRPRDRWLLIGLLVCIGISAPIVGMSRYRIPAEPFLIVLAAGWLAGVRSPVGPGRLQLALGASGVCGLAMLWAMNGREIAVVIGNAFG